MRPALFVGSTITKVKIIIWIMSALWSKKDKCRCYRLRENHNSAHKTKIAVKCSGPAKAYLRYQIGALKFTKIAVNTWVCAS